MLWRILEKCGKHKLEELNQVLAELRNIAANIETAKSLSEIEQYEVAARQYQAKSESNQEVSELLAAIEHIGSVRKRDHARIEYSLHQLVASAGKAPDQAALDLILARARDLLKRYEGDRQIGALGEQLEAVVTERRAHLASEAASRSQTFDESEELLDSESDIGSIAAEPHSVPLEERVEKPAEARPWPNRILIVAAAVCAIGIVALGVYLIAPRTVVIRTTPPGATIKVDDQSCNSPCTLKLRVGKHSLGATSSGFAPVQEALEIPWFGTALPFIAFNPIPSAPNSPSPPLPSSPSPEAGNNAKIIIRTSVPGASIFIDGSESGKTDRSGQFQLSTSIGPHQIWVQKAGFDNSSPQKVTAESNKVAVVSFQLNPSSAGPQQPPASAEKQETPATKVAAPNPPVAVPATPLPDTYLVVLAPAGAEIHINEEVRGHSAGTPLKIKVQPGQNSIDVVLAGYQPFSQTVNVAPGGQASVTAKLNPVPPPPPPPSPSVPHTPAGVSDQDRKDIQSLLEHYADAYDQKNIKAIQALWPSIPSDEVKKIKDFFRASKSIEMQLHLNKATPSDTRVLLNCTQNLHSVTDGKVMDNPARTEEIYVRKTGDAWIIDFIPVS